LPPLGNPTERRYFVNIRRLKILRDFLKTKVKDHQFRIAFWRSSGNGGCGTVACIGGWAAVMPEFNKVGLTAGPHFGEPRYKESSDFSALEKFFGLTETQARSIFDAGGYSKGFGATRQDAIRKLNRFITRERTRRQKAPLQAGLQKGTKPCT
jgi:hypothetical protein